MATSTLHVIGPPDWIAEEFRRGLAHRPGRIPQDRRRAPCISVDRTPDVQGHGDPGGADDVAGTPATRIISHDGLSPARGIGDGDAVWCSPGTLISLNDWRRRGELPPLRLAAPATDAIARLPYPLTRHPILVVRAGDVLAGHALSAFPTDLGERPWSRVASGRVAGFRAARRELDELRRDLVHAHAPADSLIELSGNVDGLVEEWCAVVDPATGTAVACSGVCAHPTPGGTNVVTVFDGARFGPGHRAASLDVAAATARALDATGRNRSSADRHRPAPPPMSLLLGFADGMPAPAVLEIDPVWCTTPYPFGREGMEAFADAIARCRMAPAPDTSRPLPDRSDRHRPYDERPYDERPHDDPFVWTPDPWMIREFSRRYRGFPPVSPGNSPGNRSGGPPGNRPPDTA